MAENFNLVKSYQVLVAVSPNKTCFGLWQHILMFQCCLLTTGTISLRSSVSPDVNIGWLAERSCSWPMRSSGFAEGSLAEGTAKFCALYCAKYMTVIL